MADEKKTTAKDDAGRAEVQANMDAINEQGFVGEEADPTPNANYTIAGVIKGAPTPETDEAQREKARKAAGFR